MAVAKTPTTQLRIENWSPFRCRHRIRKPNIFWNLRTETIKPSHTCQSKERPVLGIQRVSWYVKHKWSACLARRVHLFRGRIFLLFWCHCTLHTTLRIIKTLHHAGNIHERSCKVFQLWFAAHQSWVSKKRTELGGAKSWLPLIKTLLDLEDQKSKSVPEDGLCKNEKRLTEDRN